MSQNLLDASHSSAGNSSVREPADANTPFIHNAWYVIAKGDEVGRAPMARTVLGRSIVLFRTLGGLVVALHNRCCHRSMPLVHGTVDGDTIVCGYHGLRFDSSGRCVEIPTQEKVPKAVRVRAYCAVERGLFVWIWMGLESEANEALLPHQEWMAHREWDAQSGYLHVNGSYVHLHENLLDLSHLSFLHAKSFGTAEYARAPFELKIEGSDIQVWRRVECQLPAIYAEPLKWVGDRALRSSGSRYVTPALHINTGIFQNLDRPGNPGETAPTVNVAQLITPESQYSTHYWYLLSRNFALGQSDVSDFMLQQQFKVFNEDAVALERIAGALQLETGQKVAQISLATDRAGVMMRRHLKNLSDLEHQ